jgi:hypothetical protein
MAGSRSGEDTVLTDKKLLDTVGGTNLGNELDHLRVVVATIATDDKKRAYQFIRSWLVLQKGLLTYPRLPQGWTAEC